MTAERKAAFEQRSHFAELNGDGQTARARVCFGGDAWTVDLFAAREAG